MLVNCIEDVASRTNVILINQNNKGYWELIRKVSNCVLLDVTGDCPETIKDKNKLITFI